VPGRPLAHVAALDRGGHEVGEEVGSAGEGRGSEGREVLGVRVVVGGRAIVAQRERLVDVGAAAELDAEQEVDGVVEVVGQVERRRVERDEAQ